MPRARILLIDDNAVNLKLTAALLALENYEIAEASSAEEALAMIRDFRPQLVLTDVRLTGMDGLALVRHLRAAPEWQSIPIIALTGLHSPDDERRALEAGCTAFVSKPVQSQALRDMVRRHLGEAAAVPRSPFPKKI